MALIVTDNKNYKDIAEAIRAKYDEGNLLNISEVDNEEKYISSTTGGTVGSSSGGNWRHSGFIPIEPNTSYYFNLVPSAASIAGLAWYSSANAADYVSGKSMTALINANMVATSPNNATHLRFGWRVDEDYNPDWEETVYVCKGTTAHTTYLPSEMAPAIMSMQIGDGITPSGNLDITENGNYDVYSLSTASVNLPYMAKYTGQLRTYTDTSATSVYYGAFANCSSLSHASFPEVTRIESYAFRYCYSLSSIYFPKASYIGTCGFEYCSSITELTSAQFGSLENIGTYAFRYCVYLTDVNLSLVTSVAAQAFHNCSRLATVNLPELVSIGAGAFSYAIKVTSYSVPKLRFIASYGFYSNTSLTTITLPAVSNISGSAFRYCTKLMSLYLPGSSIPALTTTALSNTPMSTSVNNVYGSIYVPSSMVDSYKAATGWKTFSNRITAIISA